MFPNPAGFYLKLTPETEADITSLDEDALTFLAHQVSAHLDGLVQERFRSRYLLCAKSEAEVSTLNKSDLIALLRWFYERLSFLVLIPVTEQSHAATTT